MRLLRLHHPVSYTHLLVRQFGKDGLVVEIAPNSPHFINPMDLDLSMDDEVSPISLKCDFILSLMELIVGGKDGLQPVERTIICLLYTSKGGNPFYSGGNQTV